MTKYRDAIGAASPEPPVYFWNVYLYEPTPDQLKSVGRDEGVYLDDGTKMVRLERSTEDGVLAIDSFYDLARDNRDPDLNYAASWTLGEKMGDPPVLNAEWKKSGFDGPFPKPPILLVEKADPIQPMDPYPNVNATPAIAEDSGIGLGIVAAIGGFFAALFLRGKKRRR